MDLERVQRSTAAQDASLVPAWTDVLELLPDAVFIVAGADDAGRILYLNSQASRMFGYERSELIDRSVDMLVPDRSKELHERHRHAFARAPRLRNMGGSLVLHGRRRDGTEFPVEVLLKPVDGGATIAIARDMTERSELEDALRRARDSAVRANEVKSRFLAAASHDLRQPLQTIGNLQAVLARVFQHTEYAAHFALMAEAVRTMDHMLESLVDINRLETGAIQPMMRDFGLQEILPRLRSEFGYSASSKSLQLDIEESAEVVRSDPMLLPVILRNLMGNAIKYTRDGSVRSAAPAGRFAAVHRHRRHGAGHPGGAPAAALRGVLSDRQSESGPAPRRWAWVIDRADDLPASRSRGDDRDPCRQGHHLHRARAARRGG